MARRWLYGGAATAMLVAALAWAFAPRPLPVEAGSVSVGVFETAIEDDGKTRLRDPYLVSAPLTGLLGRITLREGDPVAAGAVVAAIRPAPAALLDERARREQQARLAAAQAQVGAAAAALERAALGARRAVDDARRTEQLAGAGFVAASRLEADQLAALAAQKERDSATAQRQIALHEVEQARAALLAGTGPARHGAGDFMLRAPIDGRVLRVIQTSEAVVTLGTPLLELGDPRALEVVAELLTADALLARAGSAVRIDRWGGPALRGRVRRVEPAAFTKISALGVEEQRVKVLIDLLDAPDQTAPLGVAYRVNVRILTSRRDNARKVPLSAVFPLPGAGADANAGTDNAADMAVYAIENGRARLRRVRIGARNDFEAWLLHGLEAGAQVVLYPANEVRDGVRVKVREVAPRP
jgi:HlyD family secretion protein